VFRGEFSISLDSKGRLAVPTRYREGLAEHCGGRLIATISLMDKCLVVYPYPDWKRIEDQINALPSLDPQARAISQLLIGHANECDLDGNGRILVPSLLREFAGIDRKVRMIGQVNSFELWDEEAWNKRRDELLAQVGTLSSQNSEALGRLVL
jgi:MraZ protein